MDLLKRERIPIVLAVLVIAAVAYYYYHSSWAPANPASQPYTDQQKLDILGKLKDTNQAIPPVNSQESVLNGLSKQATSSYQYSEQGKLQILKQLEAQSAH